MGKNPKQDETEDLYRAFESGQPKESGQIELVKNLWKEMLKFFSKENCGNIRKLILLMEMDSKSRGAIRRNTLDHPNVKELRNTVILLREIT